MGFFLDGPTVWSTHLPVRMTSFSHPSTQQQHAPFRTNSCLLDHIFCRILSRYPTKPCNLRGDAMRGFDWLSHCCGCTLLQPLLEYDIFASRDACQSFVLWDSGAIFLCKLMGRTSFESVSYSWSSTLIATGWIRNNGAVWSVDAACCPVGRCVCIQSGVHMTWEHESKSIAMIVCDTIANHCLCFPCFHSHTYCERISVYVILDAASRQAATPSDSYSRKQTGA